MIYLTTGTPGSFKTLSTLMYVEKFRQNELKEGRERNVYYYGIPIDKDGPLSVWIEFDTPAEWYNLPDNSIVVIDECQKEVCGFGAKSHLKQQDKTITELETHRHRGFDLFLITQGPHLINSRIKPLTNVHRHLQRRHGWNRAKLYEHDGIIKNPETASNLKSIPFTWFKPDKKFYNYYKSSTMHTVKRKIPKIFYVGVVMFFFLIFAVYKAYDVLASKVDNNPANNKSSVHSQPVNTFRSSVPIGKSHPKINSFSYGDDKEEKFNPIIAYLPRVKGMPETAPAYDELRKPVTFPKPTCIMSESRCLCFTQQLTMMIDYPDKICRSYVKYGRFEPTKPDKPYYAEANFENQAKPKVKNNKKSEEHAKVDFDDSSKNTFYDKYGGVAQITWSNKK